MPQEDEKYAFPIAMRGMTLRDYFAAAALTGLTVTPLTDYINGQSEALAKISYLLADAMLTAREVKP